MSLFFLQKTHSSIEDEKQWNDNVKGKIFYSHGTTNSCGVAIIAFLGSKSLEVVETKNNDQSRILMVDIQICDKELLLVNLYNANTEKEQLDTLIKLSEMLNSIPHTVNKIEILGGDFNLFFNTSFETQGGNPILKKKSLTELTEIKESLDLRDLWRIRNPKSKRFTFHQNHDSGRIQRRLDYFLISNVLQETVIRADVLTSFCSDHSPIIFTISFE